MLFLDICNAATALEDEIFMAHFGDQMIPVRTMTKADFVVCEDAALAEYERSIILTFSADFALLHVAHAEFIVERELLKCLTCANSLWF